MKGRSGQLQHDILEILRIGSEPIAARDIVVRLAKRGYQVDRKRVNSLLYGVLQPHVQKVDNRHWALRERRGATHCQSSGPESSVQGACVEPPQEKKNTSNRNTQSGTHVRSLPPTSTPKRSKGLTDPPLSMDSTGATKPANTPVARTQITRHRVEPPLKPDSVALKDEFQVLPQIDDLHPTEALEELAEQVEDVVGDANEEEQVEVLAELFEELTRVVAPFEPRDAVRWVNTKTSHHVVVKRPLLVDVCKHLDLQGRARWDGRLLSHKNANTSAGSTSRKPPFQTTAVTLDLSEVSSPSAMTTRTLQQAGRTAFTQDLAQARSRLGRHDGSVSDTSPTVRLRVGQILNDRYELVELAGAGGMGEVWRARALGASASARTVAIKTVKASGRHLEEALQRELSLLRTLRRTEFFPTVHDDFRHGDRLFVVMDWVDGTTLREAVNSPEAVLRIEKATFLRIMSQIADRLAYLHSWPAGEVIFRDLKPSNIMLHPETHHLRLVDFGISHLVSPDGVDKVDAGTRGYLAPEVSTGPATIQTDVFAMGRVGLFLLFGDEHFKTRTETSTPPMAYERGLTNEVVRACLRVCAVEPGRRPADALAALSVIRSALTDEDRERQTETCLERFYECGTCGYRLLRDALFCVRCGSSRQPSSTQGTRRPLDGSLSFQQPPHREIQLSSASSRPRMTLYSDLLEMRSATDMTTLQCLPHINVQPYDYQREAAVHVLSRLNGRAMIADDVGLGKTIEAGLIVSEYLERGLARTCLLAAPPGLLLAQLREEMRDKFGLRFREYRGSGDRDGDSDTVGPETVADAELVAVSLRTLCRKQNIEVLQKCHWDILLVDECHHIKNRETQTYKAIRRLVTPHVLFMSATPFSGKPDELWTVYSALMPGALGPSIREFRAAYLHDDGRPNRALRRTVRELTVRRRRRDLTVAFPGRTAIRVGVRMSDPQRKLYDSVARYICKSTNSGLARVQHLRQLSASYESLLDSKIASHLPLQVRRRLNVLSDADHPKTNALLTRIIPRLPPNEKVLIFTRFRRSQQSLVRLLTERDFTAIGLLGVKGTDRPAVIRRFREDPSIRALVCGESAGEGLNLQFCSMLINYDLPWNPMQVEQRIGRVQRIGQKRRKVTVVNLVLTDTIEDRVLTILTDKLRMFELFMGETEQILGHLIQEEGKTFEQWIANALRPDGVFDRGQMAQGEREIERAVKRAALEAKTHGHLTDDLIGTSGPSGRADQVAPAVPALDLSFLEEDW